MAIEHYHAILWIDQHQAEIYHFSRDDAQLHAMKEHGHRDAIYFREVAEPLGDAGAILLTGPAYTKLEFQKYLEDHHPTLAGRVTGVETMDHPTNPQLVAFGRHYFKSADLNTPQIAI